MSCFRNVVKIRAFPDIAWLQTNNLQACRNTGQSAFNCITCRGAQRDKYRELENEFLKMSYYRLVADFNNLFLKDQSRHIRSSSLPRDLSTSSYDRCTRSNSVECESFSSFQPSMPFRQRARSVPADDYLDAARSRYARNLKPSWHTQPRSYSHDYYLPSYNYSYKPSFYSYQSRLLPWQDYDYHYTHDHDYINPYTNYDHDYINPYTNKYEHDYINPYKNNYDHNYTAPYSYTHNHEYNYPHSYTNTPNISLSDYYGSRKCGHNPYTNSSRDVLGNWRQYSKSTKTLNMRNSRSSSPLISRELNRYLSTSGKTSYMGDYGSRGAADFRHYNYGSVPYFGASDNYHNLNKMIQYQNRVEGREF